MENSALILGIVFLLLFILPILYTVYLRRNKKANWKKRIREKTAALGYKLDELEINTKLFLALDRDKNKLVYGYLDESNFEVENIKLTDTKVNLKEIRTKEEGIKSIALVFNNAKQTKILDFFSLNDEYRLAGTEQLAIAQKWESLLR